MSRIEDVEKFKDVLTVVGRILFVMGKEGRKIANINELRRKIGTGIYQALITGVKKGYWIYEIGLDHITLTEKGEKYAKILAKLSLE